MARIIRALANEGDVPTGFPIVFDDNEHIVEPVFEYLISLAVISGRARAPETIRTYAEHLYDWFDTLEQSELDWRLVDIDTIAGYRNRMLERPSPHTGRPYSRSTINDRVQTICRFYRWAVDSGWMEALPFHYEAVRAPAAAHKTFLGHLYCEKSTVSANLLKVPEYERLPRPLRPDQIDAVFRCLPEPYRLIGDWALATGMRRCELCALTLGQVPDTARVIPNEIPLTGVSLTLTKGSKPRTVYAPVRLIDQTHWMIGEDRAALVRARKRRDPSYRPTERLFLNTRGDPVTKARLTAVFARAFDEAGIEGTLHWLRHTFAMVLLVRLQACVQHTPELNPLKIVQVLLGHSSIETTSLYLRCIELHEEAVAESVAYLYGGAHGDV